MPRYTFHNNNLYHTFLKNLSRNEEEKLPQEQMRVDDVVFPPLPLSAFSSSPFHCASQDGSCQDTTFNNNNLYHTVLKNLSRNEEEKLPQEQMRIDDARRSHGFNLFRIIKLQHEVFLGP